MECSIFAEDGIFMCKVSEFLAHRPDAEAIFLRLIARLSGKIVKFAFASCKQELNDIFLTK